MVVPKFEESNPLNKPLGGIERDSLLESLNKILPQLGKASLMDLRLQAERLLEDDDAKGLRVDIAVEGEVD